MNKNKVEKKTEKKLLLFEYFELKSIKRLKESCLVVNVFIKSTWLFLYYNKENGATLSSQTLKNFKWKLKTKIKDILIKLIFDFTKLSKFEDFKIKHIYDRLKLHIRIHILKIWN